MLNIQTFLRGKHTNLKWRFTKYYTGIESSPGIKGTHLKLESEDERICENRPTDKESIKSYCINWVKTYVSPTFEFRQYQLEYIVEILYNILNDNVKINCIEAPTGSGKSWIAFIIAGVAWEYYRKTSYILVSDLGLLDQYCNDVEKYNLQYFGRMKGLDNYKCERNNLSFPSGECKLQKLGYNILLNDELATQKGFDCALRCPVLLDRKKAMVSPITIMTYVLFLTHLNDVAPKCEDSWPAFDKRDIVICDEVHKMPEIVQSWSSPTFDIEEDIKYFRTLRDYIISNHMVDLTSGITEEDYSPSNLRKSQYEIVEAPSKEEALEAFIKYNNHQAKFADLIDPIKSKLNDKMLKGDELDKDEKRVIYACDWLSTRFERYNEYPSIIRNVGVEKMVVNSVYDPIKKEFNKKVFSLNCVFEEWLVDNFFNRNCYNEVMMSATLGDPELFRKSVGVETWSKERQEKDFKFGRVPSTFNFDNSPIYVIPTYKLTYSLKKENWPYVSNIVNQIMDAHKGQRGIIHTGSYDFSKKLMDDATPQNQRRLICYMGARNKQDCLSTFATINDSILAGPTLTEGIDLPDDLCRFMIILKVPFPSLGDQLVKAKKEIIPNWYIGTTVKTMVQSFGRGIRHKDDWCITYIVDGSFVSVFKQQENKMAPELVQRIKYISA